MTILTPAHVQKKQPSRPQNRKTTQPASPQGFGCDFGLRAVLLLMVWACGAREFKKGAAQGVRTIPGWNCGATDPKRCPHLKYPPYEVSRGMQMFNLDPKPQKSCRNRADDKGLAKASHLRRAFPFSGHCKMILSSYTLNSKSAEPKIRKACRSVFEIPNPYSLKPRTQNLTPQTPRP